MLVVEGCMRAQHRGGKAHVFAALLAVQGAFEEETEVFAGAASTGLLARRRGCGGNMRPGICVGTAATACVATKSISQSGSAATPPSCRTSDPGIGSGVGAVADPFSKGRSTASPATPVADAVADFRRFLCPFTPAAFSFDAPERFLGAARSSFVADDCLVAGATLTGGGGCRLWRSARDPLWYACTTATRCLRWSSDTKSFFHSG